MSMNLKLLQTTMSIKNHTKVSACIIFSTVNFFITFECTSMTKIFKGMYKYYRKRKVIVY